MNQYDVIYQEIKTPKGTLRGLLTKPKNHQSELMVMFHGYTGHKNENGFMFKQISREITNIGVASLRFDFLGSGDSDGDFVDMTFTSEVEDARTIIDYAYKLNNNQPIIVLGFSMGGAIAGYLSYEQNQRIKKLILLSPAGCMDQHANNTFTVNPVNEDGNVDLGGYFLNINFKNSFKNINLYRDVEKFTKPVLIVHGSKDQSVPIEYGRKYHELYPNSRFVEITDAPHCYTKVMYRQQLIENIKEFIGEEN